MTNKIDQRLWVHAGVIFRPDNQLQEKTSTTCGLSVVLFVRIIFMIIVVLKFDFLFFFFPYTISVELPFIYRQCVVFTDYKCDEGWTYKRFYTPRWCGKYLNPKQINSLFSLNPDLALRSLPLCCINPVKSLRVTIFLPPSRVK